MSNIAGLTGEWRKCVVCGMPTNQGRVCTDLLCEITINKEEEQ